MVAGCYSRKWLACRKVTWHRQAHRASSILKSALWCLFKTRKQVKFIIDNWMLIAVALTSAGLLFWPIIKGSALSGLTANEAVQMINREKAVVIDVGDATDFSAGHVAGAKSAPMGELEKKLPELVKNKAIPLIFVCQKGVRSNQAISIAKKLGYAQSHSLSGGLASWKAASLPVEKAG
jgi:rhodanese-related sulfurtransferase